MNDLEGPPAGRPSGDEIEAEALAEPEVGLGGLGDTVVRGVGLAGLGYVGAQGLTLGFFLVLARLATPADFGVFAAGTLLVNIGLLFTESGMLAAVIHREDRIDEAASTATVATAVAGLTFSLLALAASPLIGLIFHSAATARIAAGSSGLLFVRSLLVVPQALLQRRFSFLRRVIVEPAQVVVFGVVAIIATSNGLGAWGLVLGYYAGAVADVALSWGFVRWRPQRSLISFEMWRELVGYGRFVLLANGIMMAGEQLPTLLIGRFSGTASLGQYRYATRLITTPLSLIVQAGSYVLFPAFARITDDRERFHGAMLRALRLMCVVALPLGAILVPLGVPTATLLFGAVWKDAGYATMALVGIPIGGTLVSFASEVLKADGHPQAVSRIHVVLLAISAASMIALLPFGLYGVAGGVSIGWLGGSVYSLWQVNRCTGLDLREMRVQIVPPAIASLLMAAILLPIEFLVVEASSRGTFIGLCLLAAEGLLGIALYLGLLLLFAPNMVRELGSLVGRMLHRGSNTAESPALKPDPSPEA